ncbi:reverse transcriptase family protein [Kingella denitrificans]
MMNKPVTFRYPHKPIASLAKLAICLGITLKELLYLRQYSDSFYFLHERKEKPDGTFRDTYNVRDRLKIIHERIAKKFFKILDYPEYLQGGIQKRSSITNAKKHIRMNILIKEDISNFFPSISKKIVHQVWTGFFHFPHDVADCLAELVTYQGFLVQGSKVSGFLCNLIWWQREADLVAEFQKQGLVYTRFVDDVTISARRNLSKAEMQKIIGKIYSLFHSVDAKPNRKKHKVMHKGHQQTVNNMNVSVDKPTLPKEKRKEIRSIVFKCEQAFQNKEIHVTTYEELFNSAKGKILHLKRFHVAQAEKLLQRLENIQPEYF